MRPWIKDFMRVRRGSELVFLPDFGVELRVDDPGGQVAALVDLLDGTRSLPDVVAALQARWPGLTLEDVDESIASLAEAGLVEDLAAASTLGEHERERYASNLAFFSAFATGAESRYAFQERLRDAHVLLLGLGGIGCLLLLNLAGLGVGQVTVVDYDTIELKNLNRQFLYETRDIGRPKLLTAVERARAFNGDMRINAVSRRIEGPADIASLLDGVDLVLAAIDEPPDRVDDWLSQACVPEGIPVVAGGLRVSRGLYFSMDPGLSGCFTCMEMQARAARGGAPLPVVGQSGNRSTAPSTTIVAGFMALEGLRYLTGFAPPVAAGRVWLINLESGSVDVGYEWTRQPDCPVCAMLAARASDAAESVQTAPVV